MLIYGPSLDHLSLDEMHHYYPLRKVPVGKFYDRPIGPHAPPYLVNSSCFYLAAHRLEDPRVKISSSHASFRVANEPPQHRHTPDFYLFPPPEAFFSEPVALPADIWALGFSLYDVLGGQPLFRPLYGSEDDDLLADMISALGPLPRRWWDRWAGRGGFFENDGSWKRGGKGTRIPENCAPISWPLSRRMWEMGRGETPENCEWDVGGGEMRALEDLLTGMLAFEPSERLTAEEVVNSEYMVKWALPAWERQVSGLGEGVAK
jgi:serine/threonine protein kinase